jgi:hypothetical protein
MLVIPVPAAIHFCLALPAHSRIETDHQLSVPSLRWNDGFIATFRQYLMPTISHV